MGRKNATTGLALATCVIQGYIQRHGGGREGGGGIQLFQASMINSGHLHPVYSLFHLVATGRADHPSYSLRSSIGGPSKYQNNSTGVWTECSRFAAKTSCTRSCYTPATVFFSLLALKIGSGTVRLTKLSTLGWRVVVGLYNHYPFPNPTNLKTRASRSTCTPRKHYNNTIADNVRRLV